MAGRRKGSKIDGWVVLDKPLGVTSTRAVGKARWAFEARKAGHAGTLDPLGSGVLPIAFGEATKTIGLVQEALKTYRFTIRLGQRTATDDAEGPVVAASDARPADAALEAALAAFIGEIEQIPPQFSAVKVGEPTRPPPVAPARDPPAWETDAGGNPGTVYRFLEPA